jgi:hypothetical protein
MAFECKTNPCVTTCSSSIGNKAGRGLSPNDPNNPFVNLSSEAPDTDDFIYREYTPGFPPLGSFFYAVGCVGFCFSSVSQEDANLCAMQQNALCTSGNWQVPNPGSPNPLAPEYIDRPLFFNAQQMCSFTCPDGAVFEYTVPAGVFFAFSQATANAYAYSYACNKAVQNRICIGNLTSSSVCLDSAASLFVVASSRHLPVTMDIIAGALPLGMVFSQSTPTSPPSPPVAIFSGIPTVAGDFNFTLRATDAIGSTVDKNYSISVFGISNTAELPDAVLNSPYSLQLTLGGTAVGTVAYSIVSGALPDGLTLNEATGEISGTPTVDGAYQFGIKVTDSMQSCTKVFDLFSENLAPCFTQSGSLGSLSLGDSTTAEVSPIDPPDPGFHYVFTISSGSPPPGLTLVNFGPSFGFSGSVDLAAPIQTYNFCVELTQEPD